MHSLLLPIWYVPPDPNLRTRLIDLQKIKSLTRPPAPPGESAVRQPRNLDPAQHPFERAREYTRALNAVKMERMFAAPFIAQLGEGHVDGVYSMAKDPGSLQKTSQWKWRWGGQGVGSQQSRGSVGCKRP